MAKRKTAEAWRLSFVRVDIPDDARSDVIRMADSPAQQIDYLASALDKEEGYSLKVTCKANGTWYATISCTLAVGKDAKCAVSGFGRDLQSALAAVSWKFASTRSEGLRAYLMEGQEEMPAFG